MLHLYDVPDEMGVALIREVRAKKAIPVLRIERGILGREMAMGTTDAQYEIDGLAGATITSRGVSALLKYWLGEEGFKPLLDRLRTEKGN